MNIIPQQVTADLFQLSTGQLLAEFGAGNSTPGPGTAAALNGALACALILTGSKLTTRRVKDPTRRLHAEMVRAQIEDKAPILHALAQEDTDVFGTVTDARTARDRTLDDPKLRRKHADRARRRLADANDILVRIAQECVLVGKLALSMVEHVWGAAKGEPIAGVSNAIAGAMTAIGVAYLNLRKFKGKRARAVYVAVEAAMHEMIAIQAVLMRIVTGMQDAVDQTLPQQLKLGL